MTAGLSIGFHGNKLARIIPAKRAVKIAVHERCRMRTNVITRNATSRITGKTVPISIRFLP